MSSPARTITIILANLWFFGAIAVATVVGIALFPLLLAGFMLGYSPNPRRVMRLLILTYGRMWIWMIRPVLRLRVDGVKVRDFPAPAILACNHLAAVDVALMGAFWVPNHIICLRAWPFNIPYYRPFMRLAGYINVESRDWHALEDQCRRELAAGGTLVWYPEGHRSRDGKLGRFYSGVFRVAVATGAPIIPVCVKGSDKLLPPKRWWIRPATVRMRALEPVDPKHYAEKLGHTRMRRDVKQRMSEMLETMDAQDD